MPAPEPVAVQVRSPVRAGEVVDGKYRIDGILGAGGMGIVVSALHLALDEPVALKFMTLGDGHGDATARARFLREAKAARRLTSAHVARVFDVGQLTTGEPYIVMELLDGDDLAKHLRTQGRLPMSETVRYLLQVCDAIREAHALGIVHRDLKPQNLFLARRPGGATIIKVLDFGIAKSLENTGENDASLTTSQNVVGSPIYMSPEQLRASKYVDERTDIWSLGVIMFELLSGKVPFVGDSVLELGMRIMTAPAPSLVELRAEVPAALADVVQRCLEKEPEKRFPNINALALALQSFVDISSRSLPFAETATSVNPPSWPPTGDQARTGGEFAKTKGGGATTRPPRPARVWAMLALIPAALIAFAVLRHKEGPAISVPAAPTQSAPPDAPIFHVDVRVVPVTAHVRFDSEGPSMPPFARDVPRDGRAHSLTVEADGFEPMMLSFRDAPPPGEVTLKPLPQATSPHHAPPPKPAPPTAPAPPPPATGPTAPPTTTNDSPIVR